MLQKAETKIGEADNIHNLQRYVQDPFEHRILEDKDIEKSKRIILVDDDDTIRKILSLLLTELKFKVSSVDNAHDALDLFINEGADLVLTDIRMPLMDGRELAFKIKINSPKTPVILMTGLRKEEAEEGVYNCHADFILFKPFSAKYLRKVVYSFLVNKR